MTPEHSARPSLDALAAALLPALKSLPRDASTPLVDSPWLHCSLVSQEAERSSVPTASQVKHLRAVLAEARKQLEEESPHLATVLEKRFWEGMSAPAMVTAGLGWSERNVYRLQKIALARLTAVLLEREQRARQAEIEALATSPAPILSLDAVTKAHPQTTTTTLLSTSPGGPDMTANSPRPPLIASVVTLLLAAAGIGFLAWGDGGKAEPRTGIGEVAASRTPVLRSVTDGNTTPSRPTVAISIATATLPALPLPQSPVPQAISLQHPIEQQALTGPIDLSWQLLGSSTVVQGARFDLYLCHGDGCVPGPVQSEIGATAISHCPQDGAGVYRWQVLARLSDDQAGSVSRVRSFTWDGSGCSADRHSDTSYQEEPHDEDDQARGDDRNENPGDAAHGPEAPSPSGEPSPEPPSAPQRREPPTQLP